MESNEIDRGLWLKSYERANGDPEKTKAEYIRLRVAKLSKAEDDTRKEHEQMVARLNQENSHYFFYSLGRGIGNIFNRFR